MLQITPQMRVFVAVEPVDFRNGIDGLVRLCKEVLCQDPFRGGVFVFRNRRATAVKALMYDGQGFWLCQKRPSEGRFRWWPSAANDAKTQMLAAHQLHVLLHAGDPPSTKAAPRRQGVKKNPENQGTAATGPRIIPGQLACGSVIPNSGPAILVPNAGKEKPTRWPTPAR
jgi:hypothetical protein